jgi:hypothetical protein
MTRDAGLLSTGDTSPWPRQYAGFKQPTRNFSLVAYLQQSDLLTVENFLDAQGWFTIDLVSDGCRREHEVRLNRPYQLTPYGAAFELRMYCEERIALDAPDMTPYPVSVDDKDCCLPDEFNCCGATPCSEIVWFENTTTNNAAFVEVGTGHYSRAWDDSLRIAIGVRFLAGGWGWGPENWEDVDGATYLAQNYVSNFRHSEEDGVLITSNAEGLWSTWYNVATFYDYAWAATVAGETVLMLFVGAANKPGTFSVDAKCPFCPAGSLWAEGSYTLVE